MAYSSRHYYKPGTWNVICDVCGFRFKSDQVRTRWDNLVVCQTDWEADHPQKYLKIQPDGQGVPFTRKEPGEYTFVNVTYADGG